MAGFVLFKEPDILGEVTQGSFAQFPSPNGQTAKQFYYNWIELNSVSQNVLRQIESGRSGTARARSGTVMEDISVEKEVDRTTVELIQAVAGGTAFKHVWIHLCTSVADQIGSSESLHPYLELHLYAVKVTRYTLTGGGLDDGRIPNEQLNLNFDKITWKYWPIGPIPENMEAEPNKVHEDKKKLAGWDILKQAPFSG